MAKGLPHGDWGQSFERRALGLDHVIGNGTCRGCRLRNKYRMRRVGDEVLGKAVKKETQISGSVGYPESLFFGGCSSGVTVPPNPPPPLPLQLIGASGLAGWSIHEVFILFICLLNRLLSRGLQAA